ncbi:hypothetical protein KSS87_011119, partial [Heliosperma pusillum]
FSVLAETYRIIKDLKPSCPTFVRPTCVAYCLGV